MLARNRQFVAEKNLQHRGFAPLALLVSRLDKRTDDGYIDRPHQVGHKQKAVFEDTQRDHGLAAIVVGDLPPQFADPLLNLVGRDYLAQPGVRRNIHSGSGASPVICLKQVILSPWQDQNSSLPLSILSSGAERGICILLRTADPSLRSG